MITFQKNLKEKINVKLSSWTELTYDKAIFLLKFVVDIFFVLVVSRIYQYDYYVISGDCVKYLISCIMLGIICRCIPKRDERPESCFLHVQLIFMVLPMLTIYAFTENKSSQYMFIVFIAILLECLILRTSIIRLKPIKIRGINSYITVFIICFIPIISVIILIYGGFYGIQAFSLEKLYEIRNNANYPKVLSYIIMWLVNTIIPFFILYSLDLKKYIITGLLVILDIFLYMILAQKSISLIVILVIYFVIKSNQIIKVMYIGMISGLGSLSICYLIEQGREKIHSFLTVSIGLVGDRFLFQPALNKFSYYEVFNKYPKIFFADGMIGKCLGVTNLYKYGAGEIAYSNIWKGKFGESNFVTGYLGDGYAQLGVCGVLIGAIILAFIVKFVCSYYEKISNGVLCTMLSLYVIKLNDASLQTILLSGGMFIFIILLTIYAKDNEKGKIKGDGK